MPQEMKGYHLQYQDTIWQPAAFGSFVPVPRAGQKLTWWDHPAVAEIARECLDPCIRRQVRIVPLESPVAGRES